MLPRFTRPLRRMSTLSHWLRRDLDYAFPRTFQTFDVFENPERPPKVDENTYYRVEHITNNNGQIKVKTAVKEPGKAWDIRIVEEYNKDNASAIEQDKSQKRVEAIEQEKTHNTRSNLEAEKTDKTVNTKEAETAQRNNNKNEPNIKEEKVNNAENNAKDKKANAYDASSKTAENTGELRERDHGNHRNHDVARRYDRYGSPYDEIQSVFDKMERDFQDRFGRDFSIFDSYYGHPKFRRGGYGRDHHFSRRHDSPFDEVEEMFDSIDRNFGDRFSRDFDFCDYNPYHRHRGRNGYDHHNRELARKGRSHFDEFDAIFDSMERDFEDGFRRKYGQDFENPNRRGPREEDQAGNRGRDTARGPEKSSETQKAGEASKASN